MLVAVLLTGVVAAVVEEAGEVVGHTVVQGEQVEAHGGLTQWARPQAWRPQRRRLRARRLRELPQHPQLPHDVLRQGRLHLLLHQDAPLILHLAAPHLPRHAAPLLTPLPLLLDHQPTTQAGVRPLPPPRYNFQKL